MKKYSLWALAAGLVMLTGCTESIGMEWRGDDNGTLAKKGRIVTITSGVEQHEGEVETRTALNGTSVVWSTGDSFSMLDDQSGMRAVSVDELMNMPVGSSMQVALVNPSSSSGYALGYNGSQAVSAGSGMSSESVMRETAERVISDPKYQFTLSKKSASQVELWCNGRYIHRQTGDSNGAVLDWVSATGYTELTLGNQSVSSGIASGCDASHCIQFSMTKTNGSYTYYINASTSVTGLNFSVSHTDVASVWYVYTTGNGNEKFTMDPKGAGEVTAQFTGILKNEGVDHYAVYPYRADNSLINKTIHMSLPDVQTYATGTFGPQANPAVGKLEGDNIQFHNVCGVLELQLTGTETVTEISITADGNASLWGEAEVNISDLSNCNATVTGGSNTLVLNCPGGVRLQSDVATPFYFVVPVGTLSHGFTANIKTTSGVAAITTTNDVAIERSRINVMKPCGLDNLVMEELNVENPTVQYFMANSNASFTNNYSFSNNDSQFQSLRAAALGKGYRNDQPSVKTITWTGTSEARIVMSLHADYSDPVLQATSNTGSYMLRNFVPSNTYYYKVEAGNEVLTSGAFRATGQLRMIRVDDCWNIRDLGGWIGWNNNRVRYEQIYRGGALGGTYNGETTHLSDESKQELLRIGMLAHLDLRSPQNHTGDIKWVGTSWGAWAQVENGVMVSPLVDQNNFLEMNTCWSEDSAIKSSSAIGDLAFIIQQVLAGKPVYFHCRSGADRTGLLAYLVENLLGVGDKFGMGGGQQTAIDYELTSLSMDEDGTSAYLANPNTTPTYSNRPVTGCNQFVKDLKALTTSNANLTNMQERAYYYVNRYFSDHSVSTAGQVYINKSDLDLFINYMLGITDRQGNVLAGKQPFVAPSWAQDHAGNTLQQAISNAKALEYAH